MSKHLARLSTLFAIIAIGIALSFLLQSESVCRICSIFDLHFNCHNESNIRENTSTAKLDVSQFRIEPSTTIKPSSVWCTGTNSNGWTVYHEMYCRFESLCLKLDSNEYIFALDQKQSQFFPATLRTSTDQVEYGRLSSVSGHNLYSFKHIVTIPYSKLTSLSKTLFYINGQTLIMSRFKPDNLMHLIHDDLIPLFATIRQLGLNSLLDFVFIDDPWNQSLGSNLFTKLFPNALHKGNFPSDSIVCFDNSYIGLSNSSIWYQFGFLKPQSAVQRSSEEIVHIRNTIDLFRKQLILTFNLNDTCSESVSLLLIRSQNRRIVNKIQLFNHLQSRFKNLKLYILDKSSLENPNKLKALLQTFLCTRTLIAMHGSEHILSILMNLHISTQITIIELFPYGVESSQFTPFRTLAHILGYRYYSWTNKIKENTIFHSEDYPPEWGGLTHLDVEQKNSIIKSIDQPLQSFLCCDNPAWLYRIYQDTKIDVDSFDEFIQSFRNESLYTENAQLDVFRLSEVSNINCLNTGQTLTISWQTPWNLVFFSEDSNLIIHYEVLIQNVYSEEALLWKANNTNIVVKQTYCQLVGCNIWVKPTVLNPRKDLYLVGFFNRSPFVCEF